VSDSEDSELVEYDEGDIRLNSFDAPPGEEVGRAWGGVGGSGGLRACFVRQ